MTTFAHTKSAPHIEQPASKTDVKSAKTELPTNSLEESVDTKSTTTTDRSTILPGYTPVYDDEGITYQTKHAHQYAHVYTEQVYCPADYGDAPRYYVGVNDDLQPMTFPELHQLVTDLLHFYGRAAADHRREETN